MIVKIMVVEKVEDMVDEGEEKEETVGDKVVDVIGIEIDQRRGEAPQVCS